MVTRINGFGPVSTGAQAGAARPGAVDFRQVLEKTLGTRGVKISAHAEERLKARNITLGNADMERISAAADKVASKGGRDALVVMDKVGLILDVRNRTVVTAIERMQLSENVFTNIDSAVFA